jgi:hypothetical protein
MAYVSEPRPCFIILEIIRAPAYPALVPPICSEVPLDLAEQMGNTKEIGVAAPPCKPKAKYSLEVP